MRIIINEDILKCKPLKLTGEVISIVDKFDSDEQFLRSGALPVEILDRLAFGFAGEDIKELMPNQLRIKWRDDIENVYYEIEKSGLTKKQWAKNINLSEPIEVSYQNGKFWIEDGHHRYYAAKILNFPLKVNVEIKETPIPHINKNISYDDFMRCLFKQVKSISAVQ